MNEEDKINKKLLEDLKNLPKVKAPKNFETELFRKINSSSSEKKKGFWEKLLSPGKLAPTAIALVSATIIFFVVDGNSEELEDPLNIAPRLREDVVVYESYQEIPIVSEKKSERNKQNSGILDTPPNETEINEVQSEPKLGFEEHSEIKSREIDQSFADDLTTEKTDSDSFNSENSKEFEGRSIAPSSVTTSATEISKDNLNFMQRNLSTQEKMEVQQLKIKVQSEKSVKTDENSRK
ncbi:MAG: hypothetical protein WAU11_06760 [Ignavibacteriaceae bacterium]